LHAALQFDVFIQYLSVLGQ